MVTLKLSVLSIIEDYLEKYPMTYGTTTINIKEKKYLNCSLITYNI